MLRGHAFTGSKEQEVQAKFDSFNVFPRLPAVKGLEDLSAYSVGTARTVSLCPKRKVGREGSGGEEREKEAGRSTEV